MHLSTGAREVVKICQNIFNIVCERPLFTTTNNDQPTESMTIAIKGIQRHNKVAFVFGFFTDLYYRFEELQYIA